MLVVDTGTSFAHGQALLAAIAAVTDKPVKLALVTHVRPEFLFGGSAFQARGIPVAMTDRSARLMASRCETCLKTLRQVVAAAPLAGTAMYKPDQQYDDSHDLGELIGRITAEALIINDDSAAESASWYAERLASARVELVAESPPLPLSAVWGRALSHVAPHAGR